MKTQSTMKRVRFSFMIILACMLSVICLSPKAEASSSNEDGIPVDVDHFPDEAFRNWVNESLASGDGVLSKEEISSITTMDCSNLGISDLTGIEVFTQLTELDCSWNSLSTLDVSVLPNLQKLICSNNILVYLRLLKLKEHGDFVGGCVNLKYLSCENNQLVAINAEYCQTFQWIHNYAIYDSALKEYRLRPQRVEDTHYVFSNANSYLCIDVNTMFFVPGIGNSCEVRFQIQNDVELCNQEGQIIDSSQFTQHISAAELVMRPEDPSAVEWPKTPYSRRYVLDGWYTDPRYTNKFDFATPICKSISLYGRFLPLPDDYTAVTIDENSFPDDSFREYILNVIDDGDGILSAEEVALTTSVDCNSLGIEDCSGIEVFVNLISLNCSHNELTTLDLRDLTKLESIDCSDNSLVELILGSSEGACSKLHEIDCSLNQLEDLDLQYCMPFHDMPIECVSDGYQVNPQHIDGDKYVYTGSGYYVIADKDTSIISPLMVECITVEFLLGNGQQEYFVYSTYSINGYPQGDPLPSQAVLFGGKVVRPLDPTRAHMEFDGWYTDYSCTNRFDFDTEMVDMTLFGKDAPSTHRMTLYAQWVDMRREISFYYNGTMYAKQVVDCGQTVSRPESGTEMDGGFDGWYTDPGCTVAFDFGTPVQDNLTLYAKLLINEVTFPDSTFREYVAPYDIDQDGAFSQEELNTVTAIYCGNSGVTSLRGIEYFTSLVILECFGNELTELNLSRNENLEVIHCQQNKITSINLPWSAPIRSLMCYNNQIYWLGLEGRQLTEFDCSLNNLQSIDVSRFTELVYLQCNGNQLGGVDVSHNTKLVNLGCGSNGISVLNLAANKELVNLYCGNNRLTELDLSNNTKLDYLNCEKNSLTSLDLSSNTILSGLNCENNSITSLNLSSNTELAWINCANNQLSSLLVSGCTKLESIACFGNQLTELDLSNNSSLVGVWCNENGLQALDLHDFSNLVTLNCAGNQLSLLDVSGCTALQTLSFGDNPLVSFDASGCTSLTSIGLGGLSTLQTVDVSGCTALTELLCSNTPMISLNASGCLALNKIDCSHNQLSSGNHSALLCTVGRPESVHH